MCPVAAAVTALIACGPGRSDPPPAVVAPVPADAAPPARVLADAAPAEFAGFPRPFAAVVVITAADGSAPLHPQPLRVGSDRFRVDDTDAGFSFVVDAARARMLMIDRHAHRTTEHPVPEAYQPLVALARTGTPCAAASADCHRIGTERHDGSVVSVWTGGAADGFARLWLDDELRVPLRMLDRGGAIIEITRIDRAPPPADAFDPVALAAEPAPREPGLCDANARALRRVPVPDRAAAPTFRLVPSDVNGRPQTSHAEANLYQLVWRRDINGDGRADLLLREVRLCAPSGPCPMELHVDCGDGTFERVWDGLASGVRLAPRAHGFADLAVTVDERDGRCDETHRTVWRFAGRAYAARPELARTQRRCD